MGKMAFLWTVAEEVKYVFIASKSVVYSLELESLIFCTWLDFIAKEYTLSQVAVFGPLCILAFRILIAIFIRSTFSQSTKLFADFFFLLL